MFGLGMVRVINTAVLLSFLIFFVGGCSSSIPQETQEPEPQPISRFADGEATGIVQTWLGQRPYSYRPCDVVVPLFVSAFDGCRERELKEGNCLAFVNRGSHVWNESPQRDGVSRVILTGQAGQYRWDVYEQSQSVQTVVAPATSPCR